MTLTKEAKIAKCRDALSWLAESISEPRPSIERMIDSLNRAAALGMILHGDISIIDSPEAENAVD